MPRGRDEAGNIWELDANGRPVSLVQPTSFPGSIPGAFVPPNPAKLAEKQREEARQNASDKRAEAAANREALNWSASHNPDGSPKVQAPSLLGNPNLTGPEYLASLPQNIRNRVKQLIDGRSILTAREKGQPLGQQLMDAANQADPTFDENVSHARYVERTQYTGQGKGSQVVQAADRLAQHAHDLYEASRALGGPDLGWAPLSNVATATTNSFRQQKVAAYNNILPIIQGEIQKLTKNGAATVEEGKEIEAGLSVNQPQDVRDQALKTLIHLSQAQVEPLRRSWESAWAGTTAPPMPMDFHPQTQAIFDTIEQGGAPLQHNNKGGLVVPPGYGGGGSAGTGGDAPPPLGPSGPSSPPGGVPKANFSSMTGASNQSLATQNYRNVFDPVAAKTLAAFVRKGEPYATAAAYAQSHGFNPPDPQAYAQAVAYQKANPGATPNVQADRSVPTTMGERLASSPAAALVAGGATAATAGLTDVAGRALVGPEWDANRAALSATNPGMDTLGNVAGGVMGAMSLPGLAEKVIPGALARASTTLGRAAAPVADIAYGGTYGASENPNDPVMGGLTGAITGAGAGFAGRKATGGLANFFAPPEGAFGPGYAQGVFPTIGQRFGRSGFVGRATNTAEQAMQSFPGLGALVSRARQIPRNQFQIGAFNDALGDINQQLPANIGPGTEPHVFASGAFNRAYDTARSGMRFAPDEAYLADEQAFNAALGNGTLDATQANQVRQRIQTAVGSRLGSTSRRRASGALEGDAYKNAASALQQTQRDWAKTDPLKASALNDYLTIFDNAARRNSDASAVQMLDQADRGYAKLVRIQDAAARVGGDSGTFTPSGFDRAVQKTSGGVRSGPYLRGDALMQDYADAGRGLVDTLPNSGSAERLLTGQAVAGTGGFALGAPAAIAAHPGSLAPFALYAPGADALVKRLIAPRQYTLPPALADPLNLLGSKINDLAPLIGKAAVPGALAYRSSQ